jgi:N-acetyl-anhydromuramyl-L-alanine amidase AmpD
MKEYPIVQDLFTQSDAYKATKKTAATGIQVHSVGCKGTKKDRWKKSWNQPGRDVCAGYVIDTDAIWQVLPEGKRAWLSGSGPNGNANNTHLGFEICEPAKDTPENAADLYGKTLYLCVYLCRKFGIKPEKVQAHYELHALGLGSNHADVRHWWGKKGTPWEPYTMDRLRDDIAAELGTGVPIAPVIVDTGAQVRDTIRKGARGDSVMEMQSLLVRAGHNLPKWGVDGAFGDETESALKSFQVEEGIKVDGICGPETWAALLENEPGDEPEDTPAIYCVNLVDLNGSQVKALSDQWPGAKYNAYIPDITEAQAAALLAQYPGAEKAVG